VAQLTIKNKNHQLELVEVSL